MAFKVVWSQTAVGDLQEVVEFIARDSPDAAARLASLILEHIEAAASMPMSNRMVPERSEAAVREVILRPYRIIYAIDERQQQLQVLRIWHAARGIPDVT
jgi:plasmid stabilization system protein ParE